MTLTTMIKNAMIVAIIERDGKVLLAKRPSHADQASLWEPSGGKVESNLVKLV